MFRGREDGAEGDEMSEEMRAACGVKNDGGDDIVVSTTSAIFLATSV